MKICRIEGCGRRHNSNGLCRSHRNRQRKGQSLNAPVKRTSPEDTLEDRFWNYCVVTEHGVEWGGARTKGGYGLFRFKDQYWYAHRAAWHLFRRPLETGEEVDHLPTCPSTCVTIAHLRVLPKSEHTSLGWERGELNGWGTGGRKIPVRPEGFAHDRLRESADA